MDKQNGIYPFEQSTNTCYDIYETQKRYAKWKKSVAKEHTLDDSIYMKYPEKDKSIETGKRLMVAWGWGKRS